MRPTTSSRLRASALCTLLAGWICGIAPGALAALEYAASEPVGNLAGEFGVNGNGSANYSIAVQVPPGTAGLAPSLELTYDSHRGNGYLGMGWAVNGLSAITRCGASYELDGFKAGVSYDDRDRFCLDGRRLVAVTGAYGADGTVYHTEQETWTVLTSHEQCGSGPCFFTATDKDGNRLRFGGTTGTTGSRIPAQGRDDGAVRTWSIDRFTDGNDNASTVTYTVDTAQGEYYPARIDYTSNERTGLAASRSVRFVYEEEVRPDVVRRFLGGSEVQITKRLRAITTHVADVTVLEYRFDYEESRATSRSRLSSITLCDVQGVCWPPTRFTWYTEETGFGPPSGRLPGPTYVTFGGLPFVYGVLMDFNADGIADYSEAVEFSDSGSRRPDVYLGHPDGTFVKAPYVLPGPLYRVTANRVVHAGLLQDVNGDGILDFSQALRNDDTGTQDLTVHLGTGSGFVEQPSYQLPGPVYLQLGGQTLESGVLQDMDGDGIPDYSRATRLVYSGEELLEIYRGTGDGFEDTGQTLPGPLFSIFGSPARSLAAGILRDVNGDGIADYSPATVNSNTHSSDLRVFLGVSPDFTFDPAYELPDRMLWVSGDRVLASGALVDVNGDGIPDYSRATRLENLGENLLDVYLGTASGFLDAAFELPGPVYSIRDGESFIQGVLTDWNGDGTTRYSRATEWAATHLEDLAVYLGAGTGFHPAGYDLPEALFLARETGTYANGIYQDVNGDGLTDFVDAACVLEPDGSLSDCSLEMRLARGPYPDLLRSIRNGFAGTTTVEYAPLTAAGIYQRGAAVEYPIRNVEGAMYVVSGYTNGDGRGHDYSFAYTYGGARTDVRGHGWLGFETVTMTELANGRSSMAVYEQTHPFYGLVRSGEVRSGDGRLLTSSAFHYVDVADEELQARGIHQPLRSRETLTHYGADGQAAYTLAREYRYDGWGNVTLVADLGDDTTPDDDVFYCARYVNQPAVGAFGYVEQEKACKTRVACETFLSEPGEVTWDPEVDLRWSKTGYDARKNVSSQSSYDDSHGHFLTRSFTFDDYGNILSATDPRGDTTSFVYDDTYHTFLVRWTSPPLQRGDDTYRLVSESTFEPGFGMLVSTTDPNANVTTQTLDGFGRPVEVYAPDPAGAATLLVTSTWRSGNGAFYLETRQRPSWTESDPSNWYWEKDYFDGLGREYRDERNALDGDQPAVIATGTVYDAEGRIHKTSAPHFVGDPVPYTTIEYDEHNRPRLSTDPAGVREKIDYAEGGLKILRTYAYDTPDAQTEISYLTARGLVRQSVEPNGLTTDFEYTRLGELRLARTSPEPRRLRVTHDSLGRARRVEESDTGITTWDFDGAGDLRQVTDGAGNTVSYLEYDALGRVRRREMTAGTSTASALFDFDDPRTVNGLGQVTRIEQVQDPLGTWSYSYLAYTADGEVTAGTAEIAGDTYDYASRYDPLGRVVEATYPNGATLAMEYLADRNLGGLTLQETGGRPTPYVTYRDYTALGQVRSTRYAAAGLALADSYYPLGPSFPQLRTMTATGPGNTTFSSHEYFWNDLYALTAVHDRTGAGGDQSFGYKDQPLNREMGFLTRADGPYGDLSYTYDQIGNVKSKEDVVFTYPEGSDHLSATSEGESFTYFDDGNLATRSLGDLTFRYTYDTADRLLRVDRIRDGETLSGHSVYDHQGRRVFHQRVGEAQKTFWITDSFEVTDLGDGSFQHTLYVPGLAGPIAALTRSGKGDSFKLPATRTAAGGRFAPALPLLLLLSLGALVALGRRFAGGLGKVLSRLAAGDASRRPASAAFLIACLLFHSVTPALAELEPGANGPGVPSEGVVFFLPDHLGSTVTVTDGVGAATAEVRYDPYGAVDPAHSTGIDNFRPKFLGREWDPRTGFYHLGARDYAPDLSRFISPDPQRQYSSPYVYAGNSPLSYADPDGEFAFLVAVAVGAVVGAYFGGATVSHDMNPLHWDWRSGKTYGGLLAGAAIGSVGAAAGGVAIEAGVAIGASGGLAAEAAGVAVGIAGSALVGAGENAAYAALGGGSSKEILQAAGQGALFGALFAAGGEAIGGAAQQFSRRASAVEGKSATGMRRLEQGAGELCVRKSFAAEVVVLTESGLRPIADVTPGERVLGRDLEARSDALYPVGRTLRRETRDVVELTFASGHSLLTTPEHPFRLHQRGWVEAKNLGAGDRLESADGEPVTVATAERRTTATPIEVHNFTVAGVENYYVGEDKVLVHNPSKKGWVCTAEIDAAGKVTTRWNDSELKKRFPKKSEYQAIKRDIRAKTRNANKLIHHPKLAGNVMTRVGKPVRTASKEWVRYRWAQVYGNDAVPPNSVREALAGLRKHFANQDVDEYLTRINGGLTIREGMPENQGPLNSFVNQTHGAAIGALSRRVPPTSITAFGDAFK